MSFVLTTFESQMLLQKKTCYFYACIVQTQSLIHVYMDVYEHDKPPRGHGQYKS